MKVVINTRSDNFKLSLKALKRIAEIQGKQLYFYNMYPGDEGITYVRVSESSFDWNTVVFTKDFGFATQEHPDPESEYTFHRNMFEFDRTNPLLVQVVEELGDAANERGVELEVVDMPDDVQWKIEENEWGEYISEANRTWGQRGE